MDEQTAGYPQTSPPPNYLVWAVLTTVFCCLPFGIVSIVFAAQVNSKWYSGDKEGARSASNNARLWAWVAFGFGAVAIVVGIILSILGAFAGIALDSLGY